MMITRETIEKFCSGDLRQALRKPWSKNGKTFATDGKIFIAVDIDLGYPMDTNDHYPERIIPDRDAMVRQAEIPEVAPNLEACWHCSGAGKVSKEPCEECDGEGDVECDMGHTHECVDCNGTGIDPDSEEGQCPECNGTGNVENMKYPMDLGGIFFSAFYLRLVKSLPGPHRLFWKEKDLPALIEGTGWRAALMPMAF
jgi:hypothetical protein